jgi:uncharacterized membrane protein
MLSARLLFLWLHLAGVVVWFGAIAYFLLVLRPAVRRSGMERREWYRLLRHIKGRLRWVVGVALLAIVVSGVMLAESRGLWRADIWATGLYGQVFVVKLLLVAILIGIFAGALPIIERIRTPVRRGRAFLWTHVIALVVGSATAWLGLFLHG